MPSLLGTFVLSLLLKPSNARTAHLTPSTPTPTLISIAPDRTFTFTFRTPPVSHLLRLAAGIEKGSATPPGQGEGARGGETVGSVSLKHIFEIAKIKCRDEGLGALGEERVARGVIGSARSLGLSIVS